GAGAKRPGPAPVRGRGADPRKGGRARRARGLERGPLPPLRAVRKSARRLGRPPGRVGALREGRRGNSEAAGECAPGNARLLRQPPGGPRRPRAKRGRETVNGKRKTEDEDVDCRFPIPDFRSPAVSMTDIAAQVARISADNARLIERLAETERRFHRISRGVLRVQEEERGRISRDLHDGIGQSLTALKIQLELLEQEAARAQPALVPRIAAVRELAEGCLTEVREMARLLRPQMLDDLGLVPTLRWLARTVEKRTGVAVALETGSESEMGQRREDRDADTLVFRIVQEALTNVVRHSG